MATREALAPCPFRSLVTSAGEQRQFRTSYGLCLLPVASAVAGLVVALASSVVMRNRIEQLPAGASSEFLIPLVVLVAAATAAVIISARAAASVDPATTLRSD